MAAICNPAPADAQTRTGTERLNADEWKLNCRPADKATLCEVSRRLTLVRTGQLLLAVYVTPLSGEKKRYLLRYQLPHGLDLTKHVRAEVGGDKFPTPVLMTSSQTGVFARTELTDELIGLLRRGGLLRVRFWALSGNELSVPVGLSGFSTLFDKLK